MEAPDLNVLASDASFQLHALWDVMGVAGEERAAFLSQLGADVAALYGARVASQQERQAGLEGEISALRTTIENMIHAMEEDASVVRATGARRAGGAERARGRRSPPVGR